MALRDDLIPIVDDIRRTVIDEAVGLRIHSVATRRRVWSGSAIGRGAPTDTDTVLDPAPRVRDPQPHHQFAEPGKYEAGDLIVDRLSASLTRDDLMGGTLDRGVEFYWLVDGQPYTIVGADEHFLQWRVHLRRKRDR